MYIQPKDCGKVKLEARDWKSGGTKIIFMRCKKPKDCQICGDISAQAYIKPIKAAGEIYTYTVTDDNWNAVRQHLHRGSFDGYGKYPVSEDSFVLVVTKEINKSFAVPVDVDDWNSVVLATHYLDGKRRSATGKFSKIDVDKDFENQFMVTWPEPVFRGKNGETVPVSLLPSYISEFLQYFSPFDELTRENVDEYLDERARLKASLVSLFHPEYKLIGFNEVSKCIDDKTLSENWSIIPINDPSKAKLFNNPLGAQALKIIFNREIPKYEGYSRNVPAWTDYKSDDEIAFEKLVGALG